VLVKVVVLLVLLEEYVQHSIPVTDYNPNDLMRDVTPPKPRFKKRMQSGKSHQKRPSGPRPNRNR
jgi:ATP-dependent RNA helicase RhlB